MNLYFLGHDCKKPPISGSSSNSNLNYGYDDDK